MVNMRLSPQGLLYLMDFEQFRSKPYKAVSTEEFFTWGYGHYGKDVPAAGNITEEDALYLLHCDLLKYETAVNKVAHPSITQGQFDALVDLAYNCGTGVIDEDLVRGDFDDFVKTGDWLEVQKRLPSFRKSGGKVVPGLVRRRHGELVLFSGRSGKEAIAAARSLKV